MEPWNTLGIEPTNDIRAIKKAYSVKLKTARPDDDAAAYQALREAYETAQWWVNHRLVAADETPLSAGEPSDLVDVAEDTTAVPSDSPLLQTAPSLSVEPVAPESSLECDLPPQPVTVASMPEPMPLMTLASSVQQLVQSCVTQLEQDGEMQFVRMWPERQRKLEDLPMALHQEASRRFAVFAVEQNVPVEILIVLTRYFQWGLDYRVDSQLGNDLSMTLQTKLRQAYVYAALNKQPDFVDSWALTLTQLAEQGRTQWMYVLAVCMDSPTRQRVIKTDPLLLRAWGGSKKSCRMVRTAVAQGAIWQAMLFLALFIFSAYGISSFTKSNISTKEYLFTGIWIILLLELHSNLYNHFPDLDYLWPNLRRWFFGINWERPSPLILIFLTFTFATIALSLQKGILNFDPVFFLACATLMCFFIWLLIPTDEQPWRKLFLPTFALLWVGLAAISPNIPNIALLFFAFGWTFLAHVVLIRFGQHFEVLYSKLVKLEFLRERPLRLSSSQFMGPFWMLYIGPIWLLCVLACLPVFLFRLCMQRGLLYAQLAILGGVLLSGALQPKSSASWLFVSTIFAVFAIQCAQWLLQKAVDFGWAFYTNRQTAL